MTKTIPTWQFLRLSNWWALPILLAGLLLLIPQPAAADGSAPLLDPPLEGCYDVVSYGVGLFGDGEGTVDVYSPGPVVAAYLEWVGVEDTTPPEEELPRKEDSDRVQIVVPTGVVLGSLNAVAQPDGVLISWQTANEVRILGFNVLRRGVGGELEQVHKEFIFAEYAGVDQGSDYACLDKGVVSGRTYDYVLEAVMSDGRVEWYDVPSVAARWWLKLPLLLAR